MSRSGGLVNWDGAVCTIAERESKDIRIRSDRTNSTPTSATKWLGHAVVRWHTRMSLKDLWYNRVMTRGVSDRLSECQLEQCSRGEQLQTY